MDATGRECEQQRKLALKENGIVNKPAPRVFCMIVNTVPLMDAEPRMDCGVLYRRMQLEKRIHLKQFSGEQWLLALCRK